VNVPLLVSGSLALLAATVHGAGGEVLVVRKLSPDMLPATAFGGPTVTRAMIRASWHLTTVGFLTVGTALVLAGSSAHGDTARGMALVAAGAATGFAAVVLASALSLGPRALFRHPGPAVLSSVALLAWWGVAR
jgi:hypothetical protein